MSIGHGVLSLPANRRIRRTGTALAFLVTMVTVGLMAQQTSLQGTLRVIWVDSLRGPSPPPIVALIDDRGTWTYLDLDAATLRAAGGLRGLDGRRVQVVGQALVQPAPPIGRPVVPLVRVSSLILSGLPAATTGTTPPFLGARPVISILCAYGDATAADLPGDTILVRRWMGSTYPGMDHFFREASMNQMSLTGSAVAGWYRLPHPVAYYYPNGGRDFPGLVNDCMAAADPDIDFPRYDAVNLMLSTGGSGVSNGTSGALVTIDGVTKWYGVTWMGSWSPATIAHEMGHTLTWPHSAGPYGHQYDSQWDVMSGLYSFFDWSTTPATWVEQGTIAPQKVLAGWMPTVRQYVPQPATRVSLLLERHLAPISATSYLMAQIPIGSSGASYVAEVRRFVGYDSHLPFEGVLLHNVDYARPNGIEPALVVDADNNGNPNDTAAIWTPGETFADSANGLLLRVDSSTASGYWVTLGYFSAMLTIATAGQGTVATSSGGLTCVGSCTALFDSRLDSVVTLRATPDPGWVLVGWGGSCDGAASCTVQMSGDRTVTADFQRALALTGDAASHRDSVSVGSAAVRPDSAAIVLTGAGASTARWTVAKRQPWTALASDSGVGSGTLRWTRNPSGLAAGVHVDTLTVSVLGAVGSPLHILDSLVVLDLPALALTLASRSDSATLGSRQPRPDSAGVVLTGFRAETVRWTVAHARPWISIATDSGTGSGMVRWWRIPAGLPAGLHVDTIAVTAIGFPGSPARIIDSLNIYEVPVVLSCAVQDVLGSACLQPSERVYLDQNGNQDGVYDVGDLLAHLDRKGLSLSTAVLDRLTATAGPGGEGRHRP